MDFAIPFGGDGYGRANPYRSRHGPVNTALAGKIMLEFLNRLQYSLGGRLRFYIIGWVVTQLLGEIHILQLMPTSFPFFF